MKKLFSILTITAYLIAGNMCGLIQAFGGVSCEDKAAACSHRRAQPKSPDSQPTGTRCCDRLIAEKKSVKIEPSNDNYKKSAKHTYDFISNPSGQLASEQFLYKFPDSFPHPNPENGFFGRAPPLRTF